MAPPNAVLRAAIFLVLSSVPAFAWDFSATPVCTVTHAEGGSTLKMTFDPAMQIYAISVMRPDDWGDAPMFSMRFDGPRGIVISTRAHSVEGNQITATDSGFGNVLNGLQFNTRVTSFTAAAEVTMTLDGAAEPVAAFRTCGAIPMG